jgi:cytosine/adenosine deaminase-related metal-dependent hydrolase
VGQKLFSAARAGGAQALGVSGGLSVGAPADLLSLDLDHVVLAGATTDTLLDRWIFAGRHGAIDAVWRGGRQWVERGRHIAADAVAARYRRTVAGLLR